MTGWIGQTLLSSTLLMAAVMMARGPVARTFGARIAYALWLLPALRMILPPLPGFRAALWPTIERGADPSATDGIVPVPFHQMSVGPEMPVAQAADMATAAPIDWATLPLILWLVGALLWFGWQISHYRHFVGEAVRDADLLARDRGVDLLVSGQVAGPVAAGLLRRRIFLPRDFQTRYSPEEQDLALLHERAHHDRRDLFANLTALAMLAIHWWNPIAHWAYRAFRADQELACDATVLGKANGGDLHVYGSALLKSACGGMPAAACALNRKDQLKQRIGMMQHVTIGSPRRLCGALMATAMIGGGLLLTATGVAAARAPEKIAVPAVPAPPAVSPVPPLPPAPPLPKLAEIVAPKAPVAPTAPRPPAAPMPLASPAADPDPAAEAQADRRAAIADARAARAEARAAAAEARAEAREAAAEAREAARAGARAQAEVARIDVAGIVRTSLASAKAGLAARCAATGQQVSADADWNALALCGSHLKTSLRNSLGRARASILASPELSDSQRRNALAAIDEAMADIDRELAGAHDM